MSSRKKRGAAEEDRRRRIMCNFCFQNVLPEDATPSGKTKGHICRNCVRRQYPNKTDAQFNAWWEGQHKLKEHNAKVYQRRLEESR